MRVGVFPPRVISSYIVVRIGGIVAHMKQQTIAERNCMLVSLDENSQDTQTKGENTGMCFFSIHSFVIQRLK